MKAKSRKRLLISSVAMLLVAMLALGTATFAWFTTKPYAVANNISVSTNKSSFIQVSKSDLNWADTISYMNSDTPAANKLLKPASSANGTNWFYGEADNTSNYAIKADDTFTAVDSTAIGHDKAGLYVFKEMLNIKNAGANPVKDVKIKISAATMDTTARLAVVPVAEQKMAEGATDPITETTYVMPTIAAVSDFTGNIYTVDGAKSGGVSWAAANAAGAEASSTTSLTAQAVNANGAEIAVTSGTATLAANAVKSYMILVWFEGQDHALYEQSENAFTVPDISFTVTASTE